MRYLMTLLPGAILLLAGAAYPQDSYDYLDHHRPAMNVLLGWGAASMASGIPMVFSDDDLVKSAGIQNLLWGSVNTTLAILGKRADARLERPIDHGAKAEDFRKVMLINGLIDVAYIGSGVAMMVLGENDFWRGTGVGFTIQGSFLLGYDWVNFGLTFQ
jgi:hypothetical protein